MTRRIKMDVHTIDLNFSHRLPTVVLKSAQTGENLPVPVENDFIDDIVEGLKGDVPFAQGVLRAFLESVSLLGGSLLRVELSGKDQEEINASLLLRAATGRQERIATQTGLALALSLYSGVSVFAAEDLLGSMRVQQMEEDDIDSLLENEIQDLFEKFDETEFSKYKM